MQKHGQTYPFGPKRAMILRGSCSGTPKRVPCSFAGVRLALACGLSCQQIYQQVMFVRGSPFRTCLMLLGPVQGILFGVVFKEEKGNPSPWRVLIAFWRAPWFPSALFRSCFSGFQEMLTPAVPFIGGVPSKSGLNPTTKIDSTPHLSKSPP